ncbi:lysophospholipase L1-like esterase [Microbacterium resistens]|uniref:Lysophospholipase L1-like esterase n=1 Tax=Microbacterium resistens TaxID=156977 RepID=A0ABU1SIH4_9MICO|nr:GDSL-type esterase/lipase family protein [Microbacterium resistens]MDR6868808.1 lysophospholipase L1-like esterase [Microbacterium resistens]
MAGGLRRQGGRLANASRRVLAALGVCIAAAALTVVMLGQLAATVDTRSSIGQLWQGHQEELGSARSAQDCGRGVCTQSFQHGSVYWSRATGAQIVRDDGIGETFGVLGAVEAMGLPRAAEQGEAGARWQEFQRGGIFARHDEAVAVRDRMWIGWLRNRSDRGGLGFPLSAEDRDDRGTRRQAFEEGTMYVRNGSALAVRSEIADAYRDAGAGDGALGYPIAEDRAAGDGRVQRFQGGAIWWSPATGAVVVRDGILAAYAARGAEGGELGFPIEEASPVSGGVRQSFQNGVLYRADGDGSVHAASGDVQTRYAELGGADGELGLPVGDRTAILDGWYQTFSGGVLVTSPAGGTWAVPPKAFEAFAALPARFGWPVRDLWSDARGAHTAFERVETIERDGVLYSAEPVDASTAILLCDSQCDGNSWVEQGVHGNGFGTIVERAYGGGGYAAVSGSLGTSVTDGVASHRVLLPEGHPGLVVITLGGNDASQRRSPDAVLDGMRRLVDLVRQAYPDTTIVIDGVMSRRDAGHERRRGMEDIVLAEAGRLGCRTISVAGWISDYGAAQKDDVHLSQAGHDRLAGPYTEALRAALAGG